MVKETKALKEQIEAEKKRKFDLKQELAKVHRSNKKEKEPTKIVEKETQAKIDAVEYFKSLSDNQKKDFMKEVELKEVANNFPKYLKYVYGDYYKMTKFHSRLAMIGDKIVKDIEKGKNIVVCISVPPQAGKTTTITESLPSYFLGRNPNEGVIVCSYNADFAEKFGNSNREKLRNHGKELFGIEISNEMDTKTKFMFKGKHGQMVSTVASTSSLLTGFLQIADMLEDVEGFYTVDDYTVKAVDGVITCSIGESKAEITNVGSTKIAIPEKVMKATAR